MAGGVRVVTPAKVNLYLGVGSRRPDGYHEVDTVLQAIDLCDELEIVESSALGVTCEPALDLPAEENLAHRAARALGEELGRSPNVAISLRKRIPSGAGLGGGSSNAAGVLAGLAALWALAPDDPRLLDVAARLGADVAFFLGEGGATALFAGRGDVLARALPTPRFDVVVLKPPASISTVRAYAAFDRAPVAAPPPDAILAALESGSAHRIASAMSNNLERAAVALVPELSDALAWLRGLQGVFGAAVSGSGSALFAVCADAEMSRAVAELAADRGFWATATTSRDRTVTVERMGEAR